MYMKFISALAMTSLVGACGGGGGVSQTAFGSKFSESLRISNAFPNQTTAGNVPSGVGNVTYTGVGGVRAQTDASGTIINALGDATIVVDTNSGSLTGTIDQFVNSSNVSIPGSIALNSSGALAGNTIPVSGSGTVTDAGAGTNFNVTGNGIFHGPSGQSIRVTLNSGTATTGAFTDTIGVGEGVTAVVEQ